MTTQQQAVEFNNSLRRNSSITQTIIRPFHPSLANITPNILILSNLSDKVSATILMRKLYSPEAKMSIKDFEGPIIRTIVSDERGDWRDWSMRAGSFSVGRIRSYYPSLRNRHRHANTAVVQSVLFAASVANHMVDYKPRLIYTPVVNREDSARFHLEFATASHLDWSPVEFWYNPQLVSVYKTTKNFFYNYILPMTASLGMIAYAKTEAEMEQLEYKTKPKIFPSISAQKRYGRETLDETLKALGNKVINPPASTGVQMSHLGPVYTDSDGEIIAIEDFEIFQNTLASDATTEEIRVPEVSGQSTNDQGSTTGVLREG